MKPSTPQVLLTTLSLSLSLTLAQTSPPTALQDLHITRSGPTLFLDNKPWKAVGANIYWLGLDENVSPPFPFTPTDDSEPSDYYPPLKASYPSHGRIAEALSVVKTLGGTTVRSHTLGVSTGNPLSLLPTLQTSPGSPPLPSQTNPKAFLPLDYTVWAARQLSLRLMIPLTDNFDYYHGGKYDFLLWNGHNLTRARDEKSPAVMAFYEDRKVIDSFKEYVRVLLEHRNPYTNLTYAEDPTIFAYETGNELCGPVWGDMNVPAAWVREIGRHVKELAPRKLFVDGTYGVNRTHLGVEEVDIFSNHFYPISVNKLRADLELVASVNKTFFAGEYPWNAPTVADSNDANLVSWYKVLEQSPYVAGDALWSLFGHNVPDCNNFVNHSDGLTMQYGNPSHTTPIQLVRQHFLKMSQNLTINASEALPPVPCPAPVPL